MGRGEDVLTWLMGLPAHASTVGVVLFARTAFCQHAEAVFYSPTRTRQCVPNAKRVFRSQLASVVSKEVSQLGHCNLLFPSSVCGLEGCMSCSEINNMCDQCNDGFELSEDSKCKKPASNDRVIIGKH